MLAQLLDKRFQDRYNLIKQIQKNPDLDKNINDLMAATRKSRVQIYELLTEIQEDVHLISENGNTWESITFLMDGKIRVSSGLNTYFFNEYYLKESLFFKWLSAMYLETEINFELWAAKEKVSLSTIYRKWHEFKELLLDYQLKVSKRKKNIYFLAGDEKKVRYFYYRLFYFAEYPLPYEASIRNKIRSYFTALESEADMRESVVASLELMLHICLDRSKSAFFLTEKENEFEIKSRQYQRDMFLQSFENSYTRLGVAQDKVATELRYVYYFLSVENTVDIASILAKGTYFTPESGAMSQFKILNLIIFELHQNFSIKFTAEDYFYLMINGYLMIKKEELFGKMVRIGVDISEISEFKRFKKKYTPYHHENILSLRQLFVLVSPFMNNHYRVLKIMVSNRFGEGNIENIQQRLTNFSSIPLRFVRTVAEEPDIIMTDSYTLDRSDYLSMYLPPVPTDDELYGLVKELRKVYYLPDYS